MSLQIDKKYESLFNGYKNESPYRRNIVNNINKTNYKDLKEICSKIEYGLSKYDVIRIAEAYKTADKNLKNKIEYILTDINFHYECSELMCGHANNIIEENKKELLRLIKVEAINIFETHLNENRESFELNANSKDLKEYSLKELEYLEDQGVIEKINGKSNTYKLSQEYLDNYLEKKWKELDDVSFKDVDGEQVLDEQYWDFEKDITTNEDIWHYFDNNYSKGVHYLLYEYKIENSSEETEDEER